MPALARAQRPAGVVFETAGLDGRGMVLDFSDIKRLVGGWIDAHLDHRMILQRGDPAVAALEKLGEPMCLIDDSPTAENIARLVFDAARQLGVAVAEVQLWETPNCCATYRPGRVRETHRGAVGWCVSRTLRATRRSRHAN